MTRNSKSNATARTHGRGTQRTPSRASVAAEQQHHLRATAACGTLSLITGTAVGAVLMYVFDPLTGRQRRQQALNASRSAIDTAGRAAGDAYHSAGDAVGEALGCAADHLRTQAQAAADAIPAMPTAKDAADAGHRLFDRAANTAASYRDAASRRYHTWLDSARSLIPERRRPSDVSAWSAGAVVLGALAAGMGAMWLFDPNRGRGRRAWIAQKGNRIVNETGHFVRATGKHLRNKATGYAHEAGSMISDTDLAESAYAALDKLGEYASSIKVAVENGYIRLTGQAASHIVDDVLKAIRNIKGVLGIDNELEVTDMHAPANSERSHLSA